MPDKPGWALSIPAALQEIDSKPDMALWFRADIEALLQVKARRAQEIIQTAGAEQVGKSAAVARDNLVHYLRAVGGAELEAEERARRKKFAEAFRQMEKDAVEGPPRVYVEPKPETLRSVRRGGFAALTPRLKIEPGRITLDVEDVTQALEDLFSLVWAIGGKHSKDYSGIDEFARLVVPQKKKAG